MLRQHPCPIQTNPSGHEPSPEFSREGDDLMPGMSAIVQARSELPKLWNNSIIASTRLND